VRETFPIRAKQRFQWAVTVGHRNPFLLTGIASRKVTPPAKLGSVPTADVDLQRVRFTRNQRLLQECARAFSCRTVVSAECYGGSATRELWASGGSVRVWIAFADETAVNELEWA
jgi:hypothetical protein